MRLAYILLLFGLFAPQIAPAGAVHKYWVCGVTTYQSVIGGKSQTGQCRANTAYSEPPCRQFMVEYDGETGVRPGAPYSQNTGGASQARIAIEKTGDQHAYTHIINKGGDSWTYHGKCAYFEAPAEEKVYMDYGLKTAP